MGSRCFFPAMNGLQSSNATLLEMTRLVYIRITIVIVDNGKNIPTITNRLVASYGLL